MIANTIARKLEATAASWGLLPKGAAIKNDQLARDRPSRRWITSTKRTWVLVKIRKCQVRATIIHAGKYARDMLICQELKIKLY